MTGKNRMFFLRRLGEWEKWILCQVRRNMRSELSLLRTDCVTMSSRVVLPVLEGGRGDPFFA
ncbi:MAG: hypothetical protein SVY53_14485 [Chloroflexota bacterium]|nr:hypothetical protein [Chloroflexota bacterium]